MDCWLGSSIIIGYWNQWSCRHVRIRKTIAECYYLRFKREYNIDVFLVGAAIITCFEKPIAVVALTRLISC